MGFLNYNRTTEAIFADFFGFGVLRTALDLFRGKFFGQKDAPLNIPMARERILRESGSILADNVSAGVAAFGVGMAIDRLWKVPSNQFIKAETLDWFKLMGTSQTTSQQVRRAIAESLVESRQYMASWLKEPEASTASSETINNILEKLSRQASHTPKEINKHVEAATDAITTHLKLDRLDLPLGIKGKQRTWAQLPELLNDYAHLETQVKQGMQSGLDASWQQGFGRVVSKTRKANNLKLACLSVAVGLTMSIPYAIRWMTHNVDGTKGYPGELGLEVKSKAAQALSLNVSTQSPFSQFKHSDTDVTPPKSKLDEWFPYLSKSLKNKNPIPTLITLATIPFGLGLFNTYTLKFMGPTTKNLGQKWARLMQFSKGAPFTTQQQMASLFGLLIVSRLSSARTGNEFRERLVDSGLGWAVWILGTPLFKKAFAHMSDKSQGTQLLKVTDPTRNNLLGKAFRSRNEIKLIEKLAKSPSLKAMAKRTHHAHLAIDAGSFALTLLLLGIIEPLIGIFWTKHNGAEAPVG